MDLGSTEMSNQKPSVDSLSSPHVISNSTETGNEPLSTLIDNVDTEHPKAKLLNHAKSRLSQHKERCIEACENYVTKSVQYPDADWTRDIFENYLQAVDVYNMTNFYIKTLSGLLAVPPKPCPKVRGITEYLPFLQLKDRPIVKKEAEVFECAFDFFEDFAVILNGGVLPMDEHWESMLPVCLNTPERSWFWENLHGKSYDWKTAESLFLDYLDTPFRYYYAKADLWSRLQKWDEPVSTFNRKFIMSRKISGMNDGVELALCYWFNLLPEIRQMCQIAYEDKYGSGMPNTSFELMDLVWKNASRFVPSMPREKIVKSNNKKNVTSKGIPINKPGSITKGKNASVSKKKKEVDNGVKKNRNKHWRFLHEAKDDFCFWCHTPWVEGHLCQGKYEAMQANLQNSSCDNTGSNANAKDSISRQKNPTCKKENAKALASRNLN